jgi:pimeloyl-[acyl-carrier protein] methyl ester esterase
MPIIHAKDGSIISFSDQGSGSAVLFLHGWMMSQKVWHFQLPLASTLRIITVDLRGHGRSDATDFNYAACLNDIETLLDYLGLENVIVVGWSLGSQLAIKAYPFLKERISALILVGGTPRFCTTADYSAGLPLNEARGMAIRLKRDYLGTSSQFFTNMFSETEKATADLRDIAARTVAPLPPLQIALTALQELTDTDLRKLLADTDIPVHLLHGAEDNICPVGAAEFMAGHLPLASVKIFPFSGHAPFMSAADMFNAEVSAFVRKVDG